MNLENLLDQIIALPKSDLTADNVKSLKRQFSKENNLKDLPTNIQLLKLYNNFVKQWKISKSTDIENVLKKRAIRSMSGIVPIQVLTKPYFCPWKCIFCPTDVTMPKSYINTEPGAMRALLNQFDPIKQVYNRLLSLTITWHATDKIEMIVLWWTWDVYPQEYKHDFIKSLYDACNTFDEFYSQIEVDADNPKAAKFTINDNLDIKYSTTLEEAQNINENSNHRIIGLTLETRPEFVTDKNCMLWRELWVTRIEMWVQSLFEDVLEANKRWNTLDQIKNAFHKLRQYWFKISTHFMPGLYKSTLQKDIDTFKIAYEDPHYKPDEIKFYPTSVIPNTELYDLYLKGEYKPMNDEDIEKVIYEVKTKYIPPYTRIKRLIRDIPSTEIVAGSNVTNLRQIVMDKISKQFSQDPKVRTNQYSRLIENFNDKVNSLEQLYDLLKNYDFDDETTTTFVLWWKINADSNRNFICLCTRCREIRNKIENWNSKIENNIDTNDIIVIRKYISSVWTEFFISFEDTLWYLYGFTRLLLPKQSESIDVEWLWKHTAIIRELHVYWQLAKIWEWSENKTQHKWIWTQLMEISETISKLIWYQKLSVISGIWVRGYYKKLWFNLEWTYMVKDL